MKGQKIGYIRVSTPEQNPDNQLAHMELDKRFIDVSTGKHQKRPALQDMMEYVREGDEIYTEAVDRLARSVLDLNKIVQILLDKNVTIHFIREQLTFGKNSTAEEKLRLNLMGSFAQFERNILSERQREGILAARRLGKYKGRKRIFTENEVKHLRDDVALGIPISEVARKYRCSRSSVYTYLKGMGT